MAEVAMLGFSAYSGTGKTTLIEGLIKNLRARGLRVGVIKHDAHHFLVDYKGKDSWRFSQAGAELSVVASAEKTALIEQRSLGFSQVAALMHDVDLILVEGYKQENLTQIGICRKATGKGFPAPLTRYTAIVSDLEAVDIGIPCFGFDELEELTEFIVNHMDEFTHFKIQGQVKRESPSMDAWLKEAKNDASAAKIGMYLTHNGIVRETARAVVRRGEQNVKPVTGMLFSYDEEKVEAAISKARDLTGIYYVRVWLNEGRLSVGDDIMYVLIGGDIRPHVVDALQFLVNEIKTKCVSETEI